MMLESFPPPRGQQDPDFRLVKSYGGRLGCFGDDLLGGLLCRDGCASCGFRQGTNLFTCLTGPKQPAAEF